MESSSCEGVAIPSTSSVAVQNEVPLLSSGEEGDLEDEAVLLPKKKRSDNKVWIFVEKFESIKDAEEAIKTANTWSSLRKHEVEEGMKKYYRCNKVKRKGPQCAAQIYLLFDAASDAVLMYRTDSDHDHESKTHSNYGLSPKVKEEINKLFDLHLRPKAIMSALAKVEGIKLPKMSQLRNYLYDQRRSKYGKPTISLGELEAWLSSHSTVPEDDDEVYVLRYEIEENDSPKFRFALSTKFLLQLACGVKIIHADATYKLVWQGFPVFVIGSTDKDKKFHPFCLGVATSEEKDDFKMLFDALKTNISSVFSCSLQPDVLVCDASKAIQNAFVEIFGAEVTVRMCWAHAKRKIQARVEQVTRKEVQKQLLDDVDSLQAATDPEIFSLAAKAFLLKWHSETDFIKYFEEQWLIQNRNWYLGVNLGSPATKNALESFNRVIKDEHTLRERFPISRFLVVATEMVNHWSTQYSSTSAENRVFATTPTLALREWTRSYQWAKLQKKVVLTRSDDVFKYYDVPGGKAETIEEFQNKWTNFNEYKKQFFSKWEVALPLNSNWTDGKCDCPMFYKHYMCKHVMGLAIRLKLTSPPLEAKNVPIGQKRKRGRPTKSKPALIIQ
jgi:hypothetical protein